MSISAPEKITVLIVEDEMMVAMHLAMMVRNLGHDVIGIAVDAKNAMALAEKNPDLALVDNSLRDGQTGPAIARHIAEQTDGHVIFITANPQRVIDATAQHPAILGVHPKPVNDHDIKDLVSFAVSVRHDAACASPPPALRPLLH